MGGQGDWREEQLLFGVARSGKFEAGTECPSTDEVWPTQDKIPSSYVQIYSSRALIAPAQLFPSSTWVSVYVAHWLLTSLHPPLS